MSGDLGNSYNIDIWGLLIALGMVAVAAIISELMHMGIGKTKLFQLLNEDLGQIKLAQRAGVGAAGRVRGRVDFYIF